MNSRSGRAPWAGCLLAAAFMVLGAACGRGGDNQGTAQSAATGSNGALQGTLRLGYFANVTHAPALVEVADGSLRKELGDQVKLETKIFNAGPAVIEAMFAGEIDAAYLGPNPAINGFLQSKGAALRIVAGAASGGAMLVVRPSANITKPEDLAKKRIATPQLGNTQDVALRAYLRKHGLKPTENGGNVKVLPTANADSLTLFQRGDIDGAWVPEPWATRLVLEAGGKVFLDEASLWPNGQFVTTHLIVSTEYLKKNPGIVEALVRANVKAVQWINAHPEQAKDVVNKAIAAATGKGLSKETIDGAWRSLTFTYDPLASSLQKNAKDAFDTGLLRRAPDLKGIYALDTLNRVLVELGLTAVTAT